MFFLRNVMNSRIRLVLAPVQWRLLRRILESFRKLVRFSHPCTIEDSWRPGSRSSHMRCRLGQRVRQGSRVLLTKIQ